MKVDRVSFEEPSESLEATRKAGNEFLYFLCKNLEKDKYLLMCIENGFYGFQI